MLKKFFFASLLLLYAVLPLVAQENTSSSCETVEKTDEEMEQLPWYGNNDYLDQFRASDSAAFLLKGNTAVDERSGNSCPDIDGMFLIPIRFWIYRETDNDPAMPTGCNSKCRIRRPFLTAYERDPAYHFYKRLAI